MINMHCAYGICKSYSCYIHREHMIGVTFIKFSNQALEREKLKRWIWECGKIESQLNIENIARYHFICNKDFVGEAGPTDENQDPIPVRFEDKVNWYK